MASSTLATIDEEEDVDQLDAQACKMRYEALRAERARREEYLERLQEKLKAIGTEVSGRKEEVAEAIDELEEEKIVTGRRRKDAKGDREEFAKDKSSHEHVLQTMVTTLTDNYPEPRTDQSSGIEITSLIVHKAGKPADYAVDAVLVCFLPTKDAQFFCTFRVDPETKLRQLLKDSCIYWNVSEVDYVLKVAGATMLGPLTVDEAFRTKEPAFVHLVRKNIRSTTWTDLERKSIEPKIGSGLGAGEEEEAEDPDKPPADKSGEELEKTFEDRLKEFDGWHRHMTLKEHSAEHNVQHLPKLRWSFLLLYLLLFCLTVVSFSNRHSTTGIEYWAQATVHRALCDLPPGTAVPKVVGFDKVRTTEQLWRWLEAGVPAVLLDETSRFRKFNVPVGKLRLAQERIRLDNSECLPAFATEANLTCGPAEPAAPAERENMWATAQGFETWNASAARDTGDPWRYSSDNDGLVEVFGQLRPYGELGFYVEYKLDAAPANPGQLAAESVRYSDDLSQLKASGWIDAQTQAVSVSYTVYNGNWELWVSANFMLEILPGGGVLPTARVQTFRPSQFQHERLEQSTTLDWARGALIFVGYMFIIYTEVQHKRERKGGSLMGYFCSISGVLDVSILGICLGAHLVRVLGFYEDPIAFLQAIKAEGLAVAAGEGDLLHSLGMLEAAICVMLLYRLASFFRVVRIIFILWKTMTHAAQMFMTFFILFIPLFCGFVFLGMMAYGTTKQDYSAPNRAATALILMLNGDIDYLDLREPHRMGTTITVVLFSIIFILFLFNVFIALLCRAYQEARVQHGYFPRKYAWATDDYLKYFFWEHVRNGTSAVKNFLVNRSDAPAAAADDDGAGVAVDWDVVEA